MRSALRLLFNGDASQWDRAMQLPHYNSRSMPAISLHTGLHLIQVLLAWLTAEHEVLRWDIRSQPVHTLLAAYTATDQHAHTAHKPVVSTSCMRNAEIRWKAWPRQGMLTPHRALQWIRSGKFKLFDYGSKRANRKAYGEAAPPDIAAAYKLINVPVDIVAGKADGVIAPQNVRKHSQRLHEAGCKVRAFETPDPSSTRSVVWRLERPLLGLGVPLARCTGCVASLALSLCSVRSPYLAEARCASSPYRASAALDAFQLGRRSLACLV